MKRLPLRAAQVELLEHRRLLAANPLLVYPLDQTSGTTAIDASGAGRNGTLVNGPIWTTGKVGGGLQFDGSNDYVSVPNSAALNVAGALSITAWIKPDQWGSNRRILQKGTNNDQYRLTAENGLLVLDLFGTTNPMLTTALPPTGQWTHVAATYNGSQSILYMNGVVAAQQANSGAIGTTTSELTIGRKPGWKTTSYHFDGTMDDVRLYSGALTAAEVQQLAATVPGVRIDTVDANASESGSNGGLFSIARTDNSTTAVTVQYAVSGSATNGTDYTSLTGSVLIPSGQASATVPITVINDSNAEGNETVTLTLLSNVAYSIGAPASGTVTIVDDDVASPTGPALQLNLDNGSGLTATDASGFNHDGTLVNGPLWTTGQIGGGLDFDGTNDYVVVNTAGSTPAAANLNPTTGLTITAWIRPDQWTGGNRRIVQKGKNNDQYRLTADAGVLTFDVAGTSAPILTTALPPVGQWTHVAATYDGAKSSIYINGNLAAQQNNTGAINVTGDELVVGRKSGWDRYYFDGKIDDVRIYSRGLSSGEVQQIFSNPSLPTVSITATRPDTAEGSTITGQFQVSRSGSTAQSLAVNYSLGGTASSNDYSPLSGTVTIAAGSSSATFSVTPIDDQVAEANETVIATLSPSALYAIATPGNATVNIDDNDTGNRSPARPTIDEPLTDGEMVSGFDVHMQIDQAFSDPDAGQTRLNTDWEIWTTGSTPQRVWSAFAQTGVLDHHIHFGDGTFEGPQAGKNKLEPDTDYQLRVRQRDNSGALNNISPYALRNFHTLPEETPTATGWVVHQAGYRVEEVPFTFASGEPDWRLPVNIVFVPPALRGQHPGDPLFYVNELYGTIRVVTNNYTVHTYADGLLNYNPSGPISGAGENGLTGLAIDPTNGDLYATMLYDDLSDSTTDTFPKITRFHSTDGGLTASSQTDILKMPGESMHQSHIISNITFGPDGFLYVHVGDGFDTTAGQNLQTFRGKILRMNKNGTPVTSNPFYQAADRGNDGLPDAEDYVFAYGYRNPFGGAWRDPVTGRPAQHFVVENGPSIDRFSLLVQGRNYLYDGSNTSMANYNIADDGFPGDWNPAVAPVNIAFIQQSNDNYSGFPQDKWGHAFVTLSGPTAALGPNGEKSIQEWVLNDDGTRNTSVANNPQELVSYEGAGQQTAAGLAAGPDGLYFSTLYPDTGSPSDTGAKLYRVVYTG